MTTTATRPRPGAVQPKPPLPCEVLDPETFFPGPGAAGHKDRTAAVAACRACPVVRACAELALRLETGLATGYRFGIWGGLTPRERTRLDGDARAVLKAFGGPGIPQGGRAPKRAPRAGDRPPLTPCTPPPPAAPELAERLDTPCDVCGVTVAAAYIARTGRARHGHHPEPEAS